jgi:predicted dehydrogenase
MKTPANAPLRCAVIGVGYLGNFHAQKFFQADDVELVAVVDTSAERAAEIAAQYDCLGLTDYRALFGGGPGAGQGGGCKVDAVSIVTPSDTHFRVATECLEAGLHCLVEKPVTETVTEAEQLIALAEARGLVLQVGHLERFNPVVQTLKSYLDDPTWVETYRLTPFRGRGVEVDVVLDLMIHDLDILLSLVESEVVDVQASGTCVVTDRIDVARARIRFANGCVAELSASRASPQPLRRTQVRQASGYISVNYQDATVLVGGTGDDAAVEAGMRASFDVLNLERVDVLNAEILDFVSAIRLGRAPQVTGNDGLRALELAIRVSRTIAESEPTPASVSGA